MAKIRKLNDHIAVATQIQSSDFESIVAEGYKTIINNRPDGEEANQPKSAALEEEAKKQGLFYYSLPVTSANIAHADIERFDNILQSENGPILAFCRSGTRCATLWALSEVNNDTTESILKTAKNAGYDLTSLKARIENLRKVSKPEVRYDETHDVVVVGGGSAGLATSASLLKRRPNLDIAIIEPSKVNYYQPGWTMVGGGIFTANQTVRATGDVLPKGVKWIRGYVIGFDPERKVVLMKGGGQVRYNYLVIAAGLQLDLDKIDGLEKTIGNHGVTTNYQFHLAPYTWQLIKNMGQGTAIFTQPSMPIKCAGAPQKIMYLACDFWRKSKRLKDINVHFCSAGEGIFGVKDYVPTLMKYVEEYDIDLNFKETLVAVDGPSKTAWFERLDANGNIQRISRQFDIIHVTPPQSAPEFIKKSSLSNSEGWVDVDAKTLMHTKYDSIFAVGDCGSMPNAKTMAAARKQAPIVATNLIAAMEARPPQVQYDGYGSCPLTVERGKIALTEFGYEGILLPTFPRWLIDGTKPSRLAWWLKIKVMPWVYWSLMLKGREWLIKPERVNDVTMGL